jgi:hypothetical protein
VKPHNPPLIETPARIVAILVVDVRKVPNRDLFKFIKIIGEYKLRLRNRIGLEAALPELRRCNMKIDELWKEETCRPMVR